MPRPKVQTIASFSASKASPLLESPTRARARTLETPIIATVPEPKTFNLAPERHGASIFETTEEQNEPEPDPRTPTSHGVSPVETLEQLPIEIRSLTERFLSSLSKKSHATPLNINDISELFQEFYVKAESHIADHIAALGDQLSRDKSPAPSASSKRSSTPKGGTKADLDDAGGEQQMLTASEFADQKRARRKLELKRTALEESVERAVCSKIYDRIYRHRSTDDDERDAKLRSKTAALSLIGVGLKELHVNVPAEKYKDDVDGRGFEEEINEHLAPARAAIKRMNDERYPLGKLQHLTAAHKSIVDTLAQVFPSTSSADEVLPTLIYTLITAPPETINLASDHHFITLFRAADKHDGEAAYCLVNLEAAIEFLENVDLSSLNTDHLLQAPTTPPFTSSTSRPGSAADHVSGPTDALAQSRSNVVQEHEGEAKLQIPPKDVSSVTPAETKKSAYSHQRRLSTLLQEQRDRIEAGTDNVINFADQTIDSINSTLKSTVKTYLYRLEAKQSDSPGPPSVIPKTLDDARQLVSPRPRDADEGLGINISGDVAVRTVDDPLRKPEPRFLEAIAGKRSLRDRSADSTTSSGGSGKRVAFEPLVEKAAPSNATDSMGDLVKSFLPFPRFGGFGRPGGRSTSGPIPSTPPLDKSRQLGDFLEKSRSVGDGSTNTEVDLNAAESLAQLRKARSPAKKFLEAKDANELKIGDVDELLKDYKRLAELLREAIMS